MFFLYQNSSCKPRGVLLSACTGWKERIGKHAEILWAVCKT